MTRGPHEHADQTDGFAFLGPSAPGFFLWDTRAGSRTQGRRTSIVVGVSNPMAIAVPPGIVHVTAISGVSRAWCSTAPNRLFAGWQKASRFTRSATRTAEPDRFPDDRNSPASSHTTPMHPRRQPNRDTYGGDLSFGCPGALRHPGSDQQCLGTGPDPDHRARSGRIGTRDHDNGENHVTPFRVLIFADAEPHRIKQLLRHLIEDLPEVELELASPGEASPLADESRNRADLPEGHTSLGLLIQSVVGEWARSLSSIASGCLDRLLRWLHAAPFDADAGHSSVDEVRRIRRASRRYLLPRGGSVFTISPGFRSERESRPRCDLR